MSSNKKSSRPFVQLPLTLANAASAPNLGSVYRSHNNQSHNENNRRPSLANTFFRKAVPSTLTLRSLAKIPDATKGYALSTVLDKEPSLSPSTTMSPLASSHDGDVLEVGDFVDVPGNMHGTVRFIGTVNGKNGVFAGVELSEEFAARGKNNGDVDGVSYFSTSRVGAGIFLPINRASRRASPPTSRDSSTPITPSTSIGGGGFKGSSQASSAYTPPTPGIPKFSQSVGNGRAPSPHSKKTRPSLPRPESPVRKPPLSTRPSFGMPGVKTPARYASPAPGKFGQSVRGTQDSRDPTKKPAVGRNGMTSSIGPRSTSALGPSPANFSDDEVTPIGNARKHQNVSLGSVSSFNAKMRPLSRATSRAASRAGGYDDECDRLRAQIEERDRQLKDQASSLAEMENALTELQSLIGNDAASKRNRGGSIEDKDAPQLRSMLREKNEKIAMLTAEFDAHRADFRSTIDTLELASTETERVYEQRVNELLADNRELSERSEDVESVARQLKQLEELVQELEEGLEDARRGEAEARGEVEFLRGEVERTRSELRREREKAAATLNTSASHDTNIASRELEQRDDEIRGLKAIIHSLSRDAIPDTSPDTKIGKNFGSIEGRLEREEMEREIKELRQTIDSKTAREEELERELEQFRRRGSVFSTRRASAISAGTITQDHTLARDTKGAIVSWRERDPRNPSSRRGSALETMPESMPESDTYSSANESFCELCETSGHDILTCTNMFSANNQQPAPHLRTGKDLVQSVLSPKPSREDYKPAPLSPSKKSSTPASSATPLKVISNPMESGPVAGKESRVINMDKWCGVCEREGHDSIDCPFEDDF